MRQIVLEKNLSGANHRRFHILNTTLVSTYLGGTYFQLWTNLRIRIRNPDPDWQNRPTKIEEKKLGNFMF